MEEKKFSGLGFICPEVNVENALAAVSDNNGKVLCDLKGDTKEICELYLVVTAAVAEMLYKSSKAEEVEEKEKTVLMITAELAANGVAFARSQNFNIKRGVK